MVLRTPIRFNEDAVSGRGVQHGVGTGGRTTGSYREHGQNGDASADSDGGSLVCMDASDGGRQAVAPGTPIEIP